MIFLKIRGAPRRPKETSDNKPTEEKVSKRVHAIKVRNIVVARKVEVVLKTIFLISLKRKRKKEAAVKKKLQQIQIEIKVQKVRSKVFPTIFYFFIPRFRRRGRREFR